MTTVDKLVYLVQQGVITLEQVAEQYRAAVAERLPGNHFKANSLRTEEENSNG